MDASTSPTSTCPHCASPAGAGARFCTGCGAALGAPSRAERKLVSVVFADLTGFRDFAQRVDQEVAKSCLERVLGALGEVVTRYDGTVDKLVGDGVMAVFGAPLAHEDDAARAVMATLDMQQSLAEMGPAVGAPALRLSAGIATGEVVVGTVGAAGAGDPTVTGDVVNVAARLLEAAAPGQVLVDEETAALGGGGAALRQQPARQLRGRSLPVVAYVATLRRDDALRSPPARGAPTAGAPFVDRTAERAVLEAALSDSLNGRGPGLVTVVGEAGVGKSRLTMEVADALRRSQGEVAVVAVACPPYGPHPPLAPLDELAMKVLAAVEDDDSVPPGLAERVRSLTAGAVSVVMERRLGQSVRGDDPRTVVTEVVAVASARQPLLLIIDDFHLASPDVAAAVAEMCQVGGAVALGVVCAGRLPPLQTGRSGATDGNAGPAWRWPPSIPRLPGSSSTNSPEHLLTHRPGGRCWNGPGATRSTSRAWSPPFGQGGWAHHCRPGCGPRSAPAWTHFPPTLAVSRNTHRFWGPASPFPTWRPWRQSKRPPSTSPPRWPISPVLR